MDSAMRYICYTLLAACLSFLSAPAQNKNAARKLFEEGRFEEAKPMFEKLYKSNPRNSEYNYWYAACCLETGEDSVDVFPMLEFAVSRKIANAYLYMGNYYLHKRRYSEAADFFDDYIDRAKNDSLRELGYSRLEYANQLFRMVRNTEAVCFVDSFVVDKDDFLSVYRMGPDVGRLASCADYFGDDGLPGVAYESERGMDLYFSAANGDSLPKLKLYHRARIGDEWGNADEIEGFNTNGNDNYPFMLADGTTLYFASDGEGSIGGYDLFVSSYNYDEECFYRPERLGMPFNSTANDYMLAVNEVANLGWFATDRNQPEGKVCVYLFVPNGKKLKYNMDELGYDKLLSYASISSIADTQTDESLMREARRQYAMLLYAAAEDNDKGDFLFVVDDLHDYRSLSDFRSEKARALFKEWRQRGAALSKNAGLLEKKRDEYAKAATAGKNSMRSAILELELKVETEEAALERLLLEIRRVEQNELYK